MANQNRIDEINKALEPKMNQVLAHSLYQKITTPAHLQIFMEHQVFAVWDMMSLLTALQENLTKTTSPWVPVGNPEIRYLINKIVLDMETGVNIYGEHQSYFEMYLDAMKEKTASAGRIKDFLLQVTHGTDIFLLITATKLPHNIKLFLKNTFEVITEGRPHKIAAAFSFGREALIPQTFGQILKVIRYKFPNENSSLFNYYLNRHIELSRDKHASMAFDIVSELCGNNDEKWNDVKQIAEDAIDARLILWNGIEKEFSKKLAFKNLQSI